MNVRFINVIFIVLLYTSCCYGSSRQVANFAVNDTLSYHVLGKQQGNDIVIEDTINLMNKICIVPESMKLVFKGGYIKNGTLIGNDTRLMSSKACFNKVKIQGSWNVPIISTSLFGDLGYENSLRDVVALANPSVKNKIYIEAGKYQVTAQKNGDVCIPVGSNTDFVLDGEICLTPNGFRNYYIVQVTGENIKISGKGTIIGDKHTHTGTSGEWGMGIDVEDAHNVSIYGLTIKDCWGDCIYVGTESTDVNIYNCKLDHGRRQGISITSANDVLIRNCLISNVEGTNPQYAIDVEPNKNETVDNVVIENVTIYNCCGGILLYGKASNAKIGKVSIRNSIINGVTKMPINLIKCESVEVRGCTFTRHDRSNPIRQEEVKSSIIKRNRVK